ncbi:hypothetical protein ACFQ2B_21805 [Streptomyces stramineus]
MARDTDREDIAEQALLQALRIDPGNVYARGELAKLKERTKGAKLPELAKEYSETLSLRPDNDDIARRLYSVVYRLIQRTRWFALLCLLIAALFARVFPTGDDPTALPVPLGTRLYAISLMGLVWVVGAWRIYRKLPQGARTGMRAVLRRIGWSRLAVAQALWGTSLAVLVTAPPWTERGWLQALVLVGAVPLVLTMWVQRAFISAD